MLAWIPPTLLLRDKPSGLGDGSLAKVSRASPKGVHSNSQGLAASVRFVCGLQACPFAPRSCARVKQFFMNIIQWQATIKASLPERRQWAVA
jgi:hypothetical protein